MDNHPVSGHALERAFGVNGDQLDRQYKHFLSNYKDWEQKSHANEWLLFPANMGTHLSIDETAFSKGELRTILRSSASIRGRLIYDVQSCMNAQKMTIFGALIAAYMPYLL